MQPVGGKGRWGSLLINAIPSQRAQSKMAAVTRLIIFGVETGVGSDFGSDCIIATS